jgi:hypothetical protein
VKPLKRILSLGFSLFLLILTNASVSGAIRSNEGELFRTDTWYTIEPNRPYCQMGLKVIPDKNLEDYFSAFGEFSTNDQTFFTVSAKRDQIFDGNHYIQDRRITQFNGSYLFQNGIFVGMATLSNNNNNATVFSPGYRYNLNDNSYMAFSLDYIDSEVQKEILSYELNCRYYWDRAKFIGNVYSTNDDQILVQGETAFQVFDGLVTGINLIRNRTGNYFDVGATWSLGSIIIDTKFFQDEDNEHCYQVNGMFNFIDSVGIGALCQKFEIIDEPRYTVFAKYTTGHGKFKLAYTPQNGNWAQTCSVSYFMTLQ